MSFCRLIIFFFLRARAHISYSSHARKSSNSSRTTRCVRSYRSLVRRKSQQELVAKRENVFKIFPLEISTVSRPRVRIKKEHKKAREIRILRCRNRRARTSFRRPDCPSKQKFVSLDLQCTRERKKIKGKKYKNAPPEPQRLAFPFPQERPLPPLQSKIVSCCWKTW